MNEFLEKHLKDLGLGRFLFLGEWPSFGAWLLDQKWTGIHVMASPNDNSDSRVDCIVAELAMDNHFIRMLDGFWVKAVTVAEIINQFPGPYNLISIDVPERNRMLWYTDQIQDAIPKIYVLQEDGHNEGVLKRAEDRGYWAKRMDGKLVLVHS